jgi:hypothetical protein
VSVFGLNSEQIDNLWPQFGHHIERLERETELVLAESIREDLKTAQKQLWGFQQDGKILGIAITSVIETPRGRACEIYGAAGTQSAPGQIEQIMTEIERWATSIGCTRIRILGRKGWLRKIKGSRLVGYIIEKDI